MDNKQVTAEWIAQQRALCNAATPGPWGSSEPYSPMVIAKDPYKHGMMHVADVRGWGHLTGKGACNLSEGKACAIQEANSFFIAAARSALPEAIDALEASMRREAEKDAEIARLKEAIKGWADDAVRHVDEVSRLTAELSAEKIRADAAVNDLNLICYCGVCTHIADDHCDVDAIGGDVKSQKIILIKTMDDNIDL